MAMKNRLIPGENKIMNTKKLSSSIMHNDDIMTFDCPSNHVHIYILVILQTKINSKNIVNIHKYC